MIIPGTLECNDKYGLTLQRDLAINLYTYSGNLNMSPDNAKVEQHDPDIKIDINKTSTVQLLFIGQ